MSGNNKLIAQVEGYGTREEVAALTHFDIAVNQQQMPDLKKGEFYWHQLMAWMY